jgi:hypothetical protein
MHFSQRPKKPLAFLANRNMPTPRKIHPMQPKKKILNSLIMSNLKKFIRRFDPQSPRSLCQSRTSKTKRSRGDHGRPHVAAKQMLEVMHKTLAPRLHGQPQRMIEKTLAEWSDSLASILRESL